MNNTITEILYRSKMLRNNQTESEVTLWKVLRKRQLHNARFLRQHPIKFTYKKNNKVNYFISDFYCHQYRLIIEVDGPIHETQVEYDTMRESILKDIGFTVIRFTNDQINNDIEHVLSIIKQIIN